MDERDIRGRFEKGHKGGPGRPRRRSEEQYLQATISKVTLTDWKEIVEKAVTQAKRGDHRARQWLSDYVLGKPVQRSEVSGPEGGAIKHTNTVRAEIDVSTSPQFVASVLGILSAANALGGGSGEGDESAETGDAE